MQRDIGASTRRLASAADILAMCELSAFTGCNIDPLFDASAPSASADIAEPASGAMVVAGLGVFGFLRRRTRRS